MCTVSKPCAFVKGCFMLYILMFKLAEFLIRIVNHFWNGSTNSPIAEEFGNYSLQLIGYFVLIRYFHNCVSGMGNVELLLETRDTTALMMDHQ